MPLNVQLNYIPSAHKTYDFYHAELVQWLQQQADLTREVKKKVANGLCYSLTLDWLFHRNEAVAHYIPAGHPQNAGSLATFFNAQGSIPASNHRAYFIKQARDYYDFRNYSKSLKDDDTSFKLVYHNYEFHVKGHPRSIQINNFEVQHLNPTFRNYFNSGGELHLKDEPLDLKWFAPIAAEHVEKIAVYWGDV